MATKFAEVRGFLPIDDDTQNREQYILGQPPRIPPLDLENRSARQQQLVEQFSVITIDGEEIVRDDKESIEILVRHPELYAAHMEFAKKFLTEGELHTRDRELAVLRLAWLSQAPFEWGMHVIIAKKNGVTPEQIEWIVEGSEASGWSVRDRAVVRAMEELHFDSMIRDETWSVLAETFSDKQLIEITFLAGQYKTIAYYQNSLRHRLPSINKGLSSR